MRLRLFTICLLGLLFSLTSTAQIPANKLFAYSNGDIWTWFIGGNPEQITTWGYNGGPILAPDERYIAYLSLSTEGVAEIEQTQVSPFMGTAPANVWIMDTATQLAEKIAQQDSYPTLRGLPAWSPTGRELAWIEFVQGAQTNNTRLVVYDMDTRLTTILNDTVNLGFQDAGYFIHSVQWGEYGITRLYFSFVETGQLQFILELYDAATGEMRQFLLAALDGMDDTATATPVDYVWVNHQGQAMIAILMRDGTWQLLDPRNGERFELSSAPVLRNRSSSSTISPVWQSGNSGEIGWEAHDGTITSALPYVSYGISQGVPALAPDGSAVAWNNNGDLGYLMIGSPNASSLLESPEDFVEIQAPNIVWSALHWETRAATGAAIPSPVLNSGDACGMASRLSLGATVTVAQGEANNIRGEARLNAPVIAQFVPNVLAEVVDGPVCVDGFRWWYVSNADFAGWTAEGNATDYWLVPVQG